MSNPAHVPAILQEPSRHRYLKLIALFKIGKGVLRSALRKTINAIEDPSDRAGATQPT